MPEPAERPSPDTSPRDVAFLPQAGAAWTDVADGQALCEWLLDRRPPGDRPDQAEARR